MRKTTGEPRRARRRRRAGRRPEVAASGRNFLAASGGTKAKLAVIAGGIIDVARADSSPGRTTGAASASPPGGGVPVYAAPEPDEDGEPDWPAAVTVDASRSRGRLWRTFLAEQRALVRELGQLAAAVPLVRSPVLLLTDPADRLVPLRTARHLAMALPDARLQLVQGAGHHLPRRSPDIVANALMAFLDH